MSDHVHMFDPSIGGFKVCVECGYSEPMSEQSERPYRADYKKLPSEDVEKPCLFCPDGDLYFASILDAQYAANELNVIAAERDALKERVKELEEQVKELTFHLDQLIPSTPCPRCGHPALFVRGSGSLNCGCCGVHVGWDALTRHEREGGRDVKSSGR